MNKKITFLTKVAVKNPHYTGTGVVISTGMTSRGVRWARVHMLDNPAQSGSKRELAELTVI